MKKHILIACEYSGIIRDLFAEIYPEYNVVSCDFLPSEGRTDLPNASHYQGNLLDILNPVAAASVLKLRGFNRWDLIIAHPTCTYLSSSGLHWNTRKIPGTDILTPEAAERAAKTEESLEFVRMLLDAPNKGYCKHIVIENPIGCISSRIRKPDQIVQPYEYGDSASKKTCLWIAVAEGIQPLPKLVPTCTPEQQRALGREVITPSGVKIRYDNQTDSGQNKLAPDSIHNKGQRAKERSKTYDGIAIAVVSQWGDII